MGKNNGVNRAVRCNSCANLDMFNLCKLKKEFMHTNKKRRCQKYIEAENLFVEENIIPVRRGTIDKALARKQRYEIRKVLKNNTIPVDANYLSDSYPVTGDLSRFKTTSAVEETNE